MVIIENTKVRVEQRAICGVVQLVVALAAIWHRAVRGTSVLIADFPESARGGS